MTVLALLYGSECWAIRIKHNNLMELDVLYGTRRDKMKPSNSVMQSPPWEANCR